MDSTVHIWEFGEGGISTVSIGANLNEPVMINEYTTQRVPRTGNFISTTLSLTVFAGFNGTIISCRNGEVAAVVAERQEVTASVFGETIIALALHVDTTPRPLIMTVQASHLLNMVMHH